MNYDVFFHALTGKTPYRFQEELANKLIAGGSLILRAPTGAGKTWATVAPFLYSLARGRPFADRLIYALPLRSLASSLQADVFSRMRTAEGLFRRVTAIGKDRSYEDESCHCSLQIGGEASDPFFESDVTFTTIDQLLSGYLGLPVSLPRRLGNIVAGALVGAYIVLDEVHLLESERAMGTVIEMLVRLQGLCQFVLMTATVSDEATKWLASRLHAEPFIIPDAEIRRLPSQKTKRRTWRWAGCALTAEEIRAMHNGGRTIALTNTVGRAQALFGRLQKEFKATPTNVMLLHSRYFPEHRKQIEDQLATFFGPDATLTDVVLVTTQVIEAGTDISADDLLTELAPMNALIQRAGRVARYGDRNTGRVTIFDVENTRPYEDKRAFEATRTLLQDLIPEGRPVDFAEEQRWVDAVHAESELRELKLYDNLHSRRQQVREAMEGDEGMLPDLVRDVDSVSVVLTDLPEDLNFSGRDPHGRRIGWPKMLSVPRTSLMALAKYFGTVPEDGWIAKGARDAREEGPQPSFGWGRVESPGMLRSQWLIAIHPNFGSYDAKTGLVLGVGGSVPSVEYTEPSRAPRYQYEFEPWADHAYRARDQARNMQRSHRRGAEVLARTFNVAAPEQIEQLIELTCLLHDVGKLAMKWQEVAWRWQRDKDERLRALGIIVPERPQVPIAHTSFDPVSDREYAALPQYQFPNHAVEGAFAVENAVCTRFVELWGEQEGLLLALAAVSAIARHHAPRARAVGLFDFDHRAASVVAECLNMSSRNFELKPSSNVTAAKEFGNMLINLLYEEHETAWPLYAFLVRRLRLADQGSLRGAK